MNYLRRIIESLSKHICSEILIVKKISINQISELDTIKGERFFLISRKDLRT